MLIFMSSQKVIDLFNCENTTKTFYFYRCCSNAIVPNRALAFALTKCPVLLEPASQCRNYHEVTGNIICPNMVRGIDYLRDPRLNKVRVKSGAIKFSYSFSLQPIILGM